MYIEKHIDDEPRRAWIVASVFLLAALGAFGACAKPTEETAGPTSGSGSTGQGGAGGVGGGDMGGAGGAGGGPICAPGAVQECYSGPDGTKGIGVCVPGQRVCLPGGMGFGECMGEVIPVDETCETAEDEDCDGIANESGTACICVPGETQPCYSGPPDTQDVGVCVGGTAVCNELGTGFGPCEGEVVPSPEDCSNMLDDDCDTTACASSLWSIIFGGAAVDAPASIALDSAGNIYVAGTFSGTMTVGAEQLVSAGGTDGFLAKFDALGAVQWVQAFGDAADQGLTAVGVDPSDDVFVAGYFAGVLTLGGAGGVIYTANGRDAFLAKLGDTGAFLWSKKLGAAGNQGATALAVNAAGEVILGGTFEGTLICPVGCINSVGAQDIFLFKYNGQGQQQWIKVFGDPAEQILNALAYDPSGNLLMVGQFQGNAVDFGGGPLGSAGGFDIFTVKLDPNGAHIWSRRYGDPLDQRGTGIAADAAGNVFVTGGFAGSVNFGALDVQTMGFSDVFVVKFDPDAIYQWANAYGDPSDQVPGGVAADASGNAVVTGGFQGVVDFGGGPITSAVSFDIFLVKVDMQGKHVWSKGYGNSASQIGRTLAIEPASGNILVTGAAAGTIDFGQGPLTSAGGDDVTLAKITP
jgi:hypothetical protein